MINKVQAHIMHEVTEKMLVRRLLSFVPRIGDEIRLDDEKYYTVTLVCWVFDEPDCPYERVNIGVVDYKVQLPQQSNEGEERIP